MHSIAVRTQKSPSVSRGNGRAQRIKSQIHCEKYNVMNNIIKLYLYYLLTNQKKYGILLLR